MDPLTITAAAGSLAASIFSLIKLIGSFITTARNSRTELDAVSRELLSLHVCLEVLENDRKNGSFFKNELEISVSQVLNNIQLCCGQIESMLAKLKATRFGRPVKWATQQKDEVNQLRSSLETYKSALQITLQLNTISIVIKETRRLKASDTSSVQQTDQSYIAIQQIDRKIDDLARFQNYIPVLQHLQEEIASLSSSVKDFASNHQDLSYLAHQSCVYVQESLTTVHNVRGVPEIEAKLGEVLDNPFINPFDENERNSQPEVQDINTNRVGSLDNTGLCPVCPNSLSETEQSNATTKLQQLRIDWRREWTLQLKEELISRGNPGKQGSRVSAPIPGSFPPTDPFTNVSSSVSGVDDLTDLLSEVMTITSWNDGDTDRNPSDIRSISTSTSTSRSDIANKLQRLQTKYDSTRTRNQSLIEEITDLNGENLELREDIQRAHDRLAKARAVPSLQAKALQRECEELRESADQATRSLAQLQTSYDQLYNDLIVESRRAEAESREAAELRKSVTSMTQEIESLTHSAATASKEIARLQESEASYIRLLNQRPVGVITQFRRLLNPDEIISLSNSTPTFLCQLPSQVRKDFLRLRVQFNRVYVESFDLVSRPPWTSYYLWYATLYGVLQSDSRLRSHVYSLSIRNNMRYAVILNTLFDAVKNCYNHDAIGFDGTSFHLEQDFKDLDSLITFFVNDRFTKKSTFLIDTATRTEIQVVLIHRHDKKRYGFIED